MPETPHSPQPDRPKTQPRRDDVRKQDRLAPQPTTKDMRKEIIKRAQQDAPEHLKGPVGAAMRAGFKAADKVPTDPDRLEQLQESQLSRVTKSIRTTSDQIASVTSISERRPYQNPNSTPISVMDRVKKFWRKGVGLATATTVGAGITYGAYRELRPDSASQKPPAASAEPLTPTIKETKSPEQMLLEEEFNMRFIDLPSAYGKSIPSILRSDADPNSHQYTKQELDALGFDFSNLKGRLVLGEVYEGVNVTDPERVKRRDEVIKNLGLEGTSFRKYNDFRYENGYHGLYARITQKLANNKELSVFASANFIEKLPQSPSQPSSPAITNR